MSERHLFKKLLGLSEWNKINPAIQRRLEKELFATKPVHFKGIIQTVEVSSLGKLMGKIELILETYFSS